MYNTKNYQSPGGNEWVIGGKLEILEGAEVTGLPSSPFSKAENQEASTAEAVEDLKNDFNSLLEKLKTAGLMQSD